jgi:O-antigen ligase
MYFAAAFVLFCAVCTVLAFTRHPIYGLYFYLAVTYVFPPARWWGALLGTDIRWSLMAAVVTVLAVLLHFGKLRPKPFWLSNVPALSLVLYAAWMLIQYPWALDADIHLRGTTQFAKCLVAFWFVYRVVDTPERLRDLLIAHMLGCTLLGIFGLAMGRSGDRLDGVGGPGIDDANTLGMYFATGAIVALGLFMTQRGWRRWASLACIVVIVDGLVLTNTRGAFVGFIGGMLVFAYVKAKAHRRIFWALALAGLLGSTLIIDNKFVERMSTITSVLKEGEAADEDGSIESRIALGAAQLQMFRAHPWGAGHRGTELLSRQYLDERWLSRNASGGAGERSSHNTFLTALVEQGIPGAVLFVWLALWSLRMIRRLRAPLYQSDPYMATLTATTLAALAVVFVAGNTADFLLAEVQFWLFAALVSAETFVRRADARTHDPTTMASRAALEQGATRTTA